MKKIISVIIIIFIFGAGFFVGAGWNHSKFEQEIDKVKQESVASIEPADYEPLPASMMIDTGEDMLGFGNLPVNESDTVWSLLSSASESQESLTVNSNDYGELGVLVTDINGFSNGTDDKYWQFWVNNEYAAVAANLYKVKPGDVILWKFTSSRYENF